MATFNPLLDILTDFPDPRRAEGEIYKLPFVLLFSILGIVSGTDSYRGIVTFIDTHRRTLNRSLALKLHRAPSHTSIRHLLQGLDPVAVEAALPPPRPITPPRLSALHARAASASTSLWSGRPAPCDRTDTAQHSRPSATSSHFSLNQSVVEQ
jgi:hypothetical protein